jgi:hypothetical protein
MFCFLGVFAMAAPDPLLQQLHYLVGRALTNWQNVETGMYVTFHCCLGSPHDRSAAAFFHIQSADSKLSLTDRLCSMEADQTLYAQQWKPLHKQLKEDVLARNALAHFEVNRLAYVPKGTKHPIALTPHILAPVYSTDKHVRALYLENLNAIGNAYSKRAVALVAFAQKLPHWPQQSSILPPELRQALGL